jgi:putative OPT family oligopeptide transporter
VGDEVAEKAEEEAERVASTAHPAHATAGPRRELTVRAILVAIVVAALVGASYPYVVLKLGYGPNISVVSAFFGFIALAIIGAITRAKATRWENNLVQTAGTAAGQAGFMCVVLAAMDMLMQKPELGFTLRLTPWQIFAWMSTGGIIGVLLAVPVRKHYIDEENLPFADGTAAGETLLVLYRDPGEAMARLKALGIGMVSSMAFAIARVIPAPWNREKMLLPETVSFGKWWGDKFDTEKLNIGTEVGVLSIGAGLLVGVRITVSMAIGMVLSWLVAPPMLFTRGIVPAMTFKEVLRWTMWPATGLMVAGGLTALVLKWKLIVKTFRNLRAASITAEEFPMRWVVGGVVSFSVLLACLQHFSLGFPIWLTVVSLLLSAVLMLVGTRVLGETNWAPISAMANLMQAVFAALAPGSMTVNMIGSGMSGTVASNGEHLMQDYRAGKIVGSNNRHLTILQLIGVPVGALAVAVVYPALREQYGIGGDHGLSSPISVKWAGFAELLGAGVGALQEKLPGAFTAMLVAVIVGVVVTLIEPSLKKEHKQWLPSPTGIGLGMLIPALYVIPMLIGGVIQAIWAAKDPKSEDAYNTPLASGFISGEALVVLVFAILAIFGIKLGA